VALPGQDHGQAGHFCGLAPDGERGCARQGRQNRRPARRSRAGASQMNFTLERVTDPDIEPVTLEEMKRHLRCFMTVTDEDDDIMALIVAAREWVEDYTARALIDQTWRLTLGSCLGGYSIGGDRVSGYTPGLGFGRGWFGERDWLHWMRSGEIMLRKAPIIALTSFVTVDQAGVETQIDPSSFELR